jgi:hypothetical protein
MKFLWGSGGTTGSDSPSRPRTPSIAFASLSGRVFIDGQKPNDHQGLVANTTHLQLQKNMRTPSAFSISVREERIILRNPPFRDGAIALGCRVELNRK